MIENKGDLELIAGPCSINKENVNELYRLAEITITNLKGERQKALWGTRVVGLKSRTSLDPAGHGMGTDHHVVMKNLLIQLNGGTTQEYQVPPSVAIAKELITKTGINVATEIMMPGIQLPVYEREIPDGKMLIWSPSVEQLGWQIVPSAIVAARNNWRLGIKNGKWSGTSLREANDPNTTTVSDLQKTWVGLESYAANSGLAKDQIILIHRGILDPDKGDYRNVPVHEIARRAKRNAGAKLYFDPSHSCGPALRNQIVEETIKAMLMKDGNNWLYDGALIEVGTSTTDTDQHISIDEMQALAQELAKYRELHSSEPEKRVHATSWHAGDSLLSSDASLDYNFNANKKI